MNLGFDYVANNSRLQPIPKRPSAQCDQNGYKRRISGLDMMCHSGRLLPEEHSVKHLDLL